MKLWIGVSTPLPSATRFKRRSRSNCCHAWKDSLGRGTKNRCCCFGGVFWMFYLKLFHILTSQFATTTVTFRIESGCCYRFVLSLRWSTCCRFLESDLKSFKWRSSHVEHQVFSTCVPNFQDDVGNQTPRCLHTKMHLGKRFHVEMALREPLQRSMLRVIYPS